MPSISCSVIVCNEGETLQKALSSVEGLVDEIVIGIDDKSTDNTEEIARTFAGPGKLFKFSWRGDFSWARDEAIKRCDGDYIFILDGHEYIPDDEHGTAEQLARIRKINLQEKAVLTPRAFFVQLREKGLPGDMEVGCLTLSMNPDPWGIPGLFFLQPRVFRNNGCIHYVDPVHNRLDGYEREKALGCPEGIIIHEMPEQRERGRKKQRKVMNASGLYKQVKEERKKPLEKQNARPWFYMGNTYADTGKPSKAIRWYEQYIKRAKFGEEHYQALQQLAVLYMGEGLHGQPDYNQARRYALEAAVCNWRRREPYLVLAEIAMRSKDWDQGLHYLTLCSEIPAPHTVMFLQGSVYSYLPEARKIQCYEEKGEYMEAMRCTQRIGAWRPGDPDVTKKVTEHRTKLSKNMPNDRNLLIIDNLKSFTGALANHFATRFNTIIREKIDPRWVGWPNIAWFEWCNQNIIEWSPIPWEIPVIVRLHSYEAFSTMPSQVDWRNVACLVFVAEHIKDLCLYKWPELKEAVRMEVIPNGISPEGLTFKNRKHGKKIAYLGYLNAKKGVDNLLEAARMYPDYEFHVGGKFQDEYTGYLFTNDTASLHNVWFHGWIEPEQKDNWLEDMDYLISPSIVESFGYSIAEAMLKGIKPLIKERPGAIWPDTYKSMEDLGRLLTNEYDSEAYRNHILTHFSLEKQLALTDALIDDLLGIKEEPYRVTEVENIDMVGEEGLQQFDSNPIQHEVIEEEDLNEHGTIPI